jgi:hypothetical protein
VTGSGSSPLLAALTDEPTSTSDLYERVGYPALMRIGLISYPAFRAALERLEAAGQATSEPAEDGSTMWRSAPGFSSFPSAP